MPSAANPKANLLLSAAFDSPDIARESWIRWTEYRSLDDTPGWAMSLLPAVAAKLGEHPNAVPDAARLSGLRKRQWYKGKLAVERYETVAEQLRVAGIPTMVSGGFASRHLWPDPFTRPLDDGLLVVDPADGVRALAVLDEGGLATPGCSTPLWHDVIELSDATGSSIRLSCWVLGPKVTRPCSEMAWRSDLAEASMGPADLLVSLLGRRLLIPVSEPQTLLQQAEIRCLLNSAGFVPEEFARLVRLLRLGALADQQLRAFGHSIPNLGKGGSAEHRAWLIGRPRVQQLWHHRRLAAAAGLRLSPKSYVDYRRHLADHGRAESLRI